MTTITEIAPDVYRISTYIKQIDLQFNQFLIKDEQPLLWETGMKQMFPLVRDAVSKIIDPASLRWISFSHFEPDECGSLNEWLELAPRAEALCSEVGALVFVNDGAIRPARGVGSDHLIDTGRNKFRFYPTPHLPHGWDAGVLFEETHKTLLCSDLFRSGYLGARPPRHGNVTTDSAVRRLHAVDAQDGAAASGAVNATAEDVRHDAWLGVRR